MLDLGLGFKVFEGCVKVISRYLLVREIPTHIRRPRNNLKSLLLQGWRLHSDRLQGSQPRKAHGSKF